MYKLGMIDDDQQQFRRLQRRFININSSISIILVEDCIKYKDVYDWIIDNNIECLLVDYKLANRYNFTGAELVNYINSKIPDLPCVILTSYAEDAEAEKLVVKPLIFDKNLMGERKESGKLNEFINLMIYGVDVFRKRMKLNKEEYIKLLENKENLTGDQYTRLEDLFNILKSYGLIDGVSVVSLNDRVQDTLTILLEKLDKIIEE